jgi:hypothetical protein
VRDRQREAGDGDSIRISKRWPFAGDGVTIRYSTISASKTWFQTEWEPPMRALNRAVLAALVVSISGCTYHHPTPVKPAAPIFQEASIVQIIDGRAHLNAFAVAQDATVWRFREPSDDHAQWIVEPLDGTTSEAPSVSFTDKGLMQLWIVGPDRSLWTNVQKPEEAGWVGWTQIAAPPAVDVAAAFQINKGTAVVVRGADGLLQIGSQTTPGAPIPSWQPVSTQAGSRPFLFAGPGTGLEIVFAATDGALLSALAKPDGSGFDVGPVGAPKVQGTVLNVGLQDATAVTVVRAQSGQLFSAQRTERGWSTWQALPTNPSGGLADPTLSSLDGRSAMAVSAGPGNTFWASRFSGGSWSPWVDTKRPTLGASAPALRVDGHLDTLNKTILQSLAAALANAQLLGFFIFIDDVSPTQVVEGDQATASYTLMNGTGNPGVGGVTATWDNAVLVPVGTAFSPPLAPGQQFQGAFTMGPFVHAQRGPHHLRVQYEAGTIVVLNDPALGIGPIDFMNVTQFAEDRQTVQVLARSDPFPTDDPPVQAGPYTCVPTTSDQQHACGQGDGTCGGGNTPQTCPEDCPSGTPDIRSYNSQDFCRQSAGLVLAQSIADVQGAIEAAARAGTRIRVIGSKHSSNAILCTEGQIISAASLQGAAPALAPEGDYCTRFDCAASLDRPAQPVIETFEGVQTVRVGPGMQLFELENFLDQQGLSLGFGVAQFREPTVGGAIATGTHGSSPIHPSVVSTRVRSLTLVTAEGKVVELSEQTTPPNVWKAARANLGFLGVIVQVRLAVEPSFNLRGKTHWINAQDLLAPGAPQSLVGGCDWGELVWFPHRGADDAPVMVMCETKTNDSGSGELRLQKPEGSEEACKTYPALDLMQKDACDGQASCSLETTRAQTLRYYQPAFFASDCCKGAIKVAVDAPSELLSAGLSCGNGCAAGVAACFIFTAGVCAAFADCCTPECNVDVTGKWHRMITSEVTKTEFRPFERDWEIFVPGDKAQDAIRIAKNYFRENGICLPLIGVLLRFAPAEDGTLIAHTVNEGPFRSSNPGMFFEMAVFLPKGISCANKARYEKVYSDLANMLVSPPINGRGHWGKNRRSLFQLQRQLGTYGENMTQYREVVKQMDPTGMFANQFGVDIGLRWPKMSKPVPPDTETPGCTPDVIQGPPPCGADNALCCAEAPVCNLGLKCKSGFCVPPSRSPRAQCGSNEVQCLDDCNGDPFCDCTCRNKASICHLASGGTHSAPKICSSRVR